MNDSYDIRQILDQDDGLSEIYEDLDLNMLKKGARPEEIEDGPPQEI